MDTKFVIRCSDRVPIPGHGWLIEGYVEEGIAFPGTDVRLENVVGQRILIGTILGFLQGEDVADFVMEGQSCGVLMQYVDLSTVNVEECRILPL